LAIVYYYVITSFVLIVVTWLYLYARRGETTAADRFDSAMRQSGVVVPGTELQQKLTGSFLLRFFGRLGAGLASLVRSLSSPRVMAATRLRLEQAGRGTSEAVTGYIVLKIMMALIGAGSILLLVVAYHGPLLIKVASCLLVASATLLLPEATLEMLIRKRLDAIRRSLPDVIDLLAVSAEAGAGLDGAMGVVIRRKPGPLADEFSKLLLTMRLGMGRAEAWQEVVTRTPLPELRVFAAALEQADKMGVSIAKTLRTQSDAMRIKHSLRIRQLAATLALKMLFPLIFCILPALFVTVLGPGLIGVYKAMSAVP